MINWLIVHHSATSRDSTRVEAVNRYHRDKDWGGGARHPKSSLGWYVAYHYFIEGDGTVTKCANDDELRWHAGNRNGDSLGICMAGRFDKGYDLAPSEAQKNALQKLLIEKSLKYKLKPEQIVPHRKFANKTCYGNNLSDTWAGDLIKVKPKPMIGYQLKGSPEVYVQVGSKYVWVSSWEAFTALGGSAETIVQLDPSEYAKLSISNKAKLSDY